MKKQKNKYYKKLEEFPNKKLSKKEKIIISLFILITTLIGFIIGFQEEIFKDKIILGIVIGILILIIIEIYRYKKTKD